MKFLSVFLILTVFCLGAVFFLQADAEKTPKVKWHGPYYASCFAEIVGSSMTGFAKARGTGAVRNGSFMCSMGFLVTPDSGSNIRGIFSGGVSYSGSSQGSINADSSSWGSDRHRNYWSATVSDSDS